MVNMVWIPKGTSKEEEDLILEMSSQDEKALFLVMKRYNQDYWGAIKMNLKNGWLLCPVEYEELLEIHEEEVKNNQ